MKEFIEKLIGRLPRCDCFMMHRYTWICKEDLVDLINELAEEYMTCYKTCTECEAYDKEKHHCPKFCYIIAETVKEIEENHKGGWIPLSSGNIPNKDGMYLTTVFDKSTNRRMLRHRKFENGRFIEGGTSRAFPVVAWYCEPLPEPYKGE